MCGAEAKQKTTARVVVPVGEEFNAELPSHPQIGGVIPGGFLSGAPGTS